MLVCVHVHVGPRRVVQTALTSRLGVVSMKGPRFHLIRSQLPWRGCVLVQQPIFIWYPLPTGVLVVLLSGSSDCHPEGLDLEAHGSRGGCTVLWVVVYCKR